MTTVERFQAVTVHNAWCVGTSHGVIVCPTKSAAERVATLVDRHGWADPDIDIEALWTLPPVRRRRTWWQAFVKGVLG
jgi:hypothetical protein